MGVCCRHRRRFYHVRPQARHGAWSSFGNGGAPWTGFTDMFGDIDANFSSRGWGRGQGYGYPNYGYGYGPYGYAGPYGQPFYGAPVAAPYAVAPVAATE